MRYPLLLLALVLPACVVDAAPERVSASPLVSCAADRWTCEACSAEASEGPVCGPLVPAAEHEEEGPAWEALVGCVREACAEECCAADW